MSGWGGSLAALAVLTPLALAAALAVPGLRPAIGRLAPLAAVPALVLALIGEGRTLDAPWALLGVRLGATDALARGFLLFTALLWLIAAWFAHAYLAAQPRRTAFWAWFLVTMTGNLGVIVADDMATFYLGFALMSLASYGLILHARTHAAVRAGKVYLTLALFGDVLILAALLAISPGATNLSLAEVPAAAAASPYATHAAVLLLAGFGVKAGAVLPLHVWLPLAHPVAPTPASALLSGAMIKVGLLGWLRFLPLGELALVDLGTAWIAIGLAAAFYGALNGVTHRDAKTVLAYSSISQMGMMMIALGVAVRDPAAAAVATPALVAFATHHALAKAALFMGTAIAKQAGSRRARIAWTVVLAWPALEIAGAPFSSGALAKLALKDVVALHPDGARLATALSVAAIGSTLLMARFLYVVTSRTLGDAKPAPVALWLPLAALLVIDAVLFASSPRLAALAGAGAVWTATWPLLAGASIAGIAWRLGRRGVRLPSLAAGDVLVVFEWAVGRARALAAGLHPILRRHTAALRRARAWLVAPARLDRWGGGLDRAEATLQRFPVNGLLLAALFGALVWALWP